MAVAAAAALPALSRVAVAPFHRGRPPAYHRATLPRRGELQRHQGARGETRRDLMAVAGAARVARQTRAGEIVTRQRTHAKAYLWRRGQSAFCAADSGAL